MIVVGQANYMITRIVMTYMDSIVQERPIQRVVALCEAASISRTTFYNHFENMVDLDQRFLSVYAGMVLDSLDRPFSGYVALKNCYLSVVEAQKDQLEFFRKILVDPSVVRYRYRWFEAVEAYLLDDYQALLDGEEPHQRDFIASLAVGVVRRYFEWATLRSGDRLSCDTDWMLEYLWLGVEMCNQRARGQWAPRVMDIDTALGQAGHLARISS